MDNQSAAEMPKYQCHKQVWALKLRQVVKHALPEANTTPEQDAAFEASDAFHGAFLFPENEMYAPISVDAAYFRKHNPQAGGYYVVYGDGYASWSPGAEFEAGYTPI